MFGNELAETHFSRNQLPVRIELIGGPRDVPAGEILDCFLIHAITSTIATIARITRIATTILYLFRAASRKYREGGIRRRGMAYN
jgi:hypothetical protein